MLKMFLAAMTSGEGTTQPSFGLLRSSPNLSLVLFSHDLVLCPSLQDFLGDSGYAGPRVRACDLHSAGNYD